MSKRGIVLVAKFQGTVMIDHVPIVSTVAAMLKPIALFTVLAEVV